MGTTSKKHWIPMLRTVGGAHQNESLDLYFLSQTRKLSYRPFQGACNLQNLRIILPLNHGRSSALAVFTSSKPPLLHPLKESTKPASPGYLRHTLSRMMLWDIKSQKPSRKFWPQSLWLAI